LDAPHAVIASTPELTGEAAARLAAIVTSSDDAIVSKNLDGIIQSWNASAERLFGYTAEEAIGRSIRLIVPPDRQGEEDEILSRIRRGERVDHLDTVRLRKDGTLIPISVTISPISDATGRVIGASKIARDISERRRAEEAIRQSMAVKDEFLNLVSHELRTPTATIVGNLQILLRRGDTLDSALRQQALEDAATEANRLVTIVENLLILTRLHGDVAVETEPLKLDVYVAASVEAALRKHPGRVIHRHEEPVPPVLAEPILLEMVLDNLLSNALKYSAADAPVEIRLSNRDGCALVTVADRGIGVAPEDREAIFESFYRSEAAKVSAGGMGLGLAVCQRAIRGLKGKIWVEPREGGGSEFSFTLPTVLAPAK
jgi:PAS domain S-box-containing protein